MIKLLSFVVAAATLAGIAPAQTPPAAKPYQVEWVYRVKYGYQDEFWRLFQKYQIGALDEEKRRGYVQSYSVFKPGLHTSEESRWDYRIVITYNGQDGASHEGEVTRALFPDTAALKRDENRRWELTTNHWDLPIHEIDPHQIAQ
ncbi:hypothetical protein FHS31_000107 [Sphingomonas vulcanisoli]|uniref:Uncharacterized protein n=1 Tax=Sphingomonas vulcanisoli TaxID=1658060 RepID=A0ABX0TQV4_9SPHN|nr:hypothetical protein [Sphingomonas vulcanisoli]NIJ06525.1 hypothetical protein [Sphingomonas vulcanisoli]